MVKGKKRKKALDLDVLNKSRLPKKCFFRNGRRNGELVGHAEGSWLVLMDMVNWIKKS